MSWVYIYILGYFYLRKLGHVKTNLTCFNFKPGLGKKLDRNVFFSYHFLHSFILRYFLLDYQIAFRSIKSIELR